MRSQRSLCFGQILSAELISAGSGGVIRRTQLPQGLSYFQVWLVAQLGQGKAAWDREGACKDPH